MRTLNNARTQKARGALALSEEHGWQTPEIIVISTEDEIEKDNVPAYVTRSNRPINFARPCPPTPEHGFVESRVVQSGEEVRGVLREAKAAHPDSELMLMPWMEPEFSGILSDGMLAMGAGHDAATAGKQALRLPIGPLDWGSKLLMKAGITEAPYLEFVSNRMQANHYGATNPHYSDLDGHVLAVQLRNGPKAVMALDFIPTGTTVQEIVYPCEDMIEWKKKCEALKGRVGVVVQLQEGSTLLSHEAVHCISNNIPCVTTHDVELGERLEPVALPTTFDFKFMVEGMKAAIPTERYGISAYTRAMRVALFACHHHAYLRSTPEGCRLIGIGAAFAAQLGALACLGELRHKRRYRGSREAVFHKANKNLGRAISALTRAEQQFSELHWSSGYGGKRWAECAAVTIGLVNAMLALAKKPTQEKAEAVIEKLHTVIHVAHNGGRFLNKFISQSEMDYAATGKASWVLHQAVPATFYALLREPATKPPVTGRRTMVKRHVPSFVDVIFQIRRPAALSDGANMIVHAQHKKPGDASYSSVNFTLPTAIVKVLMEVPALAPSLAWSKAAYYAVPQGLPSWDAQKKVTPYIRLHVRKDGKIYLCQHYIGHLRDLAHGIAQSDGTKHNE